MRELGSTNKSLNTKTGMIQRGFDQLAREQRIYARESNDSWHVKRLQTDQRAVRNSPLLLQFFAVRHRTVKRQPPSAGGWISWTRVASSLVCATDNGNASATEEPRVEQLKPPQSSAGQQAKTRAKRSRATSQHEDRGQLVEKTERTFPSKYTIIFLKIHYKIHFIF